MFTQWHNHLTTHFSERNPDVKQCMTVHSTQSNLEWDNLDNSYVNIVTLVLKILNDFPLLLGLSPKSLMWPWSTHLILQPQLVPPSPYLFVLGHIGLPPSLWTCHRAFAHVFMLSSHPPPPAFSASLALTHVSGLGSAVPTLRKPSSIPHLTSILSYVHS